MAYERTTDTTKGDQNTKLLGDSLDGAVQGAIETYKAQVAAEDAVAEGNFQSLVAAGNMSLADQLAYRKNQLAGTSDSATRATLRASISTLNAQITQKKFSDGYTTQLQQNAAGLESIQSVISWLQGQLTTASDTSVIDKINSELVTQQGNLFQAQQKTLADQTTYAKNSGNMDKINAQITTLAAAKATALLSGDTATAANLDLQIQDLQNFVTTQKITTTMQNLATATVTGASSATGLLNSYQTQISSSDSTTPIVINGTSYASEQAFWTQTRDSYIADTSATGFFGRLQGETTDALKVKASNNTLSVADLQAVNAQYAQLATNPILAPFAAQLATSKQGALQTGADALSQVIEDNFDQSLDLNTALTALKAIQDQGVNVDSTTQKILNDAAQTQSQAVQSIMAAASTLIASNPGMSITAAVTQAVASGAGTVIPNNQLLSSTPTATAEQNLTANANGTATSPSSTTVAPTTTPPGGTTLPSGTAAGGIDYTLHPGETIDQYDARIAQERAAAGQGTTPAAPAATPNTTAATGIDYTLHPGETVAAYNARIAAARAAAASTTNSTVPNTISTPITTPPTSTPVVPPKTTTTTPPASVIQPAPPTVIPGSPSTGSSSTVPQSVIQPAPPVSAGAAPATIHSSDPYNPPTGLTQTKTAGGGTAYTDKTGNLYVQSSPGVYTLNNSLK